MKSILPYILLMTGTLFGAVAIVGAVYFLKPQLLGVAPRPAQAVAQKDSLAAKSLSPASAQKSDSSGGKPDSLVHGAASPAFAGGDGRAPMADSIRTLLGRIDAQKKIIEQLTAKSSGAGPFDSTAKPAVSDSARAKDSKSFAKMLETMPAEQAVRILKGLDDREVKAVLLSVKKRQAAKILSALDPERAARMMRTL